MNRVALALVIVLLLIIPGCMRPYPQSTLTSEQQYRLQLVEEIKAFEKELGFEETENFKTYSDEVETYDFYFYTPRTTLPYSLDDPSLRYGTGKPQSAPFDLKEFDVFAYSVEAIAGVKTPVTRSLLRAPLARFIHIIFHEDWHEQIDSPLGIEEPTAEVVSYAASLRFAEEKFGRDSAVFKTLNQEFQKKLKESEIYQRYYDELSLLYSQFRSGKLSKKETLSRKSSLLQAMGDELKDLWGGKPAQLNNAFIAFQMTYFRHFPLMYQVFSATDYDLEKTIDIFRWVPSQGVKFGSVEELKRIEAEVTDYLQSALTSKRGVFDTSVSSIYTMAQASQSALLFRSSGSQSNLAKLEVRSSFVHPFRH
ncbi:MAG TPA: aminopeptidase [Dehalococcoidia bacterium]|nr:aminopeptidase [Dehalococcoidia bacterium]